MRKLKEMQKIVKAKRSNSSFFIFSAPEYVDLGSISPTFYARLFLYESFWQSFFVLNEKVKLFIGAKEMAQLCSKNVGEIDSCSQFTYILRAAVPPISFPPKRKENKEKENVCAGVNPTKH